MTLWPAAFRLLLRGSIGATLLQHAPLHICNLLLIMKTSTLQQSQQLSSMVFRLEGRGLLLAALCVTYLDHVFLKSKAPAATLSGISALQQLQQLSSAVLLGDTLVLWPACV